MSTNGGGSRSRRRPEAPARRHRGFRRSHDHLPGPSPFAPRSAENTTPHLARLAHAGLARAIHPCHTPGDGDAIFALATGRHREAVDFMALGALAAEVSSLAIVRALRQARSLPGLPAAADLAAAG